MCEALEDRRVLSASASLIGTDAIECLTEADQGQYESHDSDQHADTTQAGVCVIIGHAHEPASNPQASGVSRLPELPGLTLVDPSTDVTGQIIYLDFDGADDVIYNGPVTVGPFDVPAFEAPGELAGQEEAIIASVVEQLEDDVGDVQLFPQSAEDKCRSDARGAHAGSVALAVRVEYHDGFGESRTGLQQRLKLSVFLQSIKSSERGDDVLLCSSVFPTVLDNLQIDALPGLFLSEKHGDTPYATMNIHRHRCNVNANSDCVAPGL